MDLASCLLVMQVHLYTQVQFELRRRYRKHSIAACQGGNGVVQLPGAELLANAPRIPAHAGHRYISHWHSLCRIKLPLQHFTAVMQQQFFPDRAFAPLVSNVLNL